MGACGKAGDDKKDDDDKDKPDKVEELIFASGTSFFPVVSSSGGDYIISFTAGSLWTASAMPPVVVNGLMKFQRAENTIYNL